MLLPVDNGRILDTRISYTPLLRGVDFGLCLVACE
jgi:hypothetical protein